MRTIKPGKLAAATVANKKQKQSQSPTKERQIWSDFQVGKKNKKKREYERDEDGRLVPKPQDNREGKDAENIEEEGPPPKARTDYEVIEEKLGYTFKDRELISRALTHRSVLGIQERSDYERLEFVGDAVLDLSVAHLLCKKHPDAREGDLSKMRAALVNTTSLAEIGRRLELGPFIKLGRGELSSGGADRPSILADVVEALFGAMYWDSDYETALKVITDVFGDELEVVTPSDPKTELQEALHAAGSEPPEYLVELVEGPQHSPTFVTVVVVDGEVAGRGKGPTKKAAQQEAASIALAKLTASNPTVELAEQQTFLLKDALLVNFEDETTDAEASDSDKPSESSEDEPSTEKEEEADAS